MRHGRTEVGVALAAMLLVSGCSAPTGTPPPTSAEPTPEHGFVVVTVHDVVGLEGGGLAGVLYEGSEMLHVRAVGGFGAAIDADPFTTTQTVKRLSRAISARELFPYATRRTLLLHPTTYTLFLWADPLPLTPYSETAPADPVRFGCYVTFDVRRSAVRLSIDGVKPIPIAEPIDRCTVD